MIGSVLALVTAIFGFAVWFYKRKVAADEKPDAELEKRENKTRKDLVDNNIDALNVHLDGVLREINRNTVGQGSGLVENRDSESKGWIPRSEGKNVGNP